MTKIKNIEKASQLLKEAVKQQENIILYGDSDLDGTCSVIILQETLNYQNTYVYFPDRVNEGYGLNLNALNYLQEEISNNFLLVILDSGITNFKEIAEAEKRGIKVIIVDHHQPLKEMPKASLIVDPKQENDFYPFKNFANTGIVFRLAEEILQDSLSIEKRNSFLELTALATIADMMEQKQDNEFFIKKGLESLQETQRLGLKVLKKSFSQDLSIREKAQQIVTVLNAADVVNHKTISYNLLTCQDEDQAQQIVDNLISKSKEKQDKVNLVMDEIEKEIDVSEKIVFKVSDQWEASLLGTVASRICHKTKKPVFLLKKKDNVSRGTVRAPLNVNVVDVMEKYSNLLESFGGHPPAAGFIIKNINIEKFKDKLINHFE